MAEGVLTIAMTDPFDVIAIDDVRRVPGYKIRAVVSSEEEINSAREKYYRKRETMEDILADVKVKTLEVLKEKEVVDLEQIKEEGETLGIIRFVNHLLAEAVEKGASDIHIEPYEEELRLEEGAKIVMG